MREIKFRVWDNEDKEMYKDIIIGNDTVNEWFEYSREDNFSPTQYTGIKDRNGVEIYEGDILEGNTDVDEAGVVEWNDESASYCVYTSFCGINIRDYMEGHSVEIIGNKFENKELLKN
jgi:uncharacterized phage protein (TIGR01671 family)